MSTKKITDFIPKQVRLSIRGFVLWILIAIAAGDIQAQTTPFTVTTFRANNGEMITRSRIVNLTIAARSSQAGMLAMRLGDSARDTFGNFVAYKTSIAYNFPDTATGRHIIAIQFVDKANNLSPQYNLQVDIVPDFPVMEPLTKGPTPGASLRRGNISSVALVPAVVDTADPIVQMSTAAGEILVQLYPDKAPLTVTNFLKYVDGNLYDNSFFHRSVAGFVIQGGGFFIDTSNNNTISPIGNFGAVINEPGDSNTRGTIAMAKVDDDPNSATNQWFFNLADNSGTLDEQNGGFTVFGKVLTPSMSIVDAIAALPRSNQSSSLGFGELPLFRVPASGQNPLLSDLVLVHNTSRFRFYVMKQIPGVKATIENNFLVLQPDGKPTSTNSSLMLRAVTPEGRFLDFPVVLNVATNDPMLAAGVGTRSLRTSEDKPIDIPIPVTNPDNSPLQWEINPQPSKGTSVLLPQTKPGVRVIRYTPNLNSTGTDTFTVKVFDDNTDPQKRGRDQLVVQMQIKPVNDAPTITGPGIVNGVAPGVVQFDVNVGDVETPAASLLLTGSASGSSVVKNSFSIQGTGSTRTIIFQSNAVTSPVIASVNLSVTDGETKRTTVKLPVTISPGT